MFENVIWLFLGIMLGISISLIIVHFHYKKTGCYECAKIKKKVD